MRIGKRDLPRSAAPESFPRTNVHREKQFAAQRRSEIIFEAQMPHSKQISIGRAATLRKTF
jgi:hypothetical protein